MLKIKANLKSTFYEDKEIQDIMKELYLSQKNHASFHLFDLEQLPKHFIGILFGVVLGVGEI